MTREIKHDVVVGIDPDVEMSGVGILYLERRLIDLKRLDFPDLIRLIVSFSMQENVLLVIEAGWLNESNWHLRRGCRASEAAAIGNAVGRNHETGRKIDEVARSFGLETVLQKPLKKIWQGKDGKITADEFNRLTGYSGRSNQDERDAGLLAWYWSGLPMRMIL